MYYLTDIFCENRFDQEIKKSIFDKFQNKTCSMNNINNKSKSNNNNSENREKITLPLMSIIGTKL